MPRTHKNAEANTSETIVINFFAEKEQNDPNGKPYGYVRNVLDVMFQDRNRRILGPRAGFLEGYYMRWGYQGPRLFYELQTAERTYERLTGSRPDWYYDKDSRVLFISTPSRDTHIMVLATRERRIEEVEQRWASEFRKAACAAAKKILARVLTSHGAYPTARGSIETDGDKVRDEGLKEWDEVEKKLEVSLASVPPPMWVG